MPPRSAPAFPPVGCSTIAQQIQKTYQDHNVLCSFPLLSIMSLTRFVLLKLNFPDEILGKNTKNISTFTQVIAFG